MTTVDAAWRQADIAMYSAKRAGRNRAVVYSAPVQQALREHRAAGDRVDALRAERDRLHTEARTDALTGLANRRALDEIFDAYRGPLPATVLFIDLDHFSSYNHRHGDHQGDRALKTVAETLRRACRDVDLVFRKGGEEFVAVLPGTGGDSGHAAGERVRLAVEALGLEHGGVPDTPVVTGTIGWATRTDGDLTAALHEASNAALHAKNEGRRNRVVPDPDQPCEGTAPGD